LRRRTWGTKSVANFDLERLERQVEELLAGCQRLREENHSLRVRQETLVAERAELIEKTEQARGRVEAMLARLKAMEEQL
jgi:cell division protein ZapB